MSDEAATSASTEQRHAEAMAVVRLLRESGHRRQYLLLAYRCDGRGRARRCLLAEVYGTPAGPVLFLPGGRAHPAFAQPENGARHPDRARFLRQEDAVDVDADSYLASSSMTFSCKHYRHVDRTPVEILADVTARRGELFLTGSS